MKIRLTGRFPLTFFQTFDPPLPDRPSVSAYRYPAPLAVLPCRLVGMAVMAYRLQVVVVVCSAVCNLGYVIDLSRYSELALCLAYLAQPTVTTKYCLAYG